MRTTFCSQCRRLAHMRLQLRIQQHQLQRQGGLAYFHTSFARGQTPAAQPSQTAPSSLQEIAKAIQTSQTLQSSKDKPGITSLYSDTFPPSDEQKRASQNFFATHLPRKSWTGTEWRKLPSSFPSDAASMSSMAPEIIFLGRSNSGKSSLLNALLDQPGLCRVGPRPGKTTTMHAWALSPSDPVTGGAVRGFAGKKGDTDVKAVLLDMPGYGHGSQTAWGKDIVKYLRSRKQLRRAFVLINAAHGVKKTDKQMLELLVDQAVSHQIIVCKCDDVRPDDLPGVLAKIRDDVKQSASLPSTTLGGAVPGRVTRTTGGRSLVTLNDVLAVGGLGDGRMNLKPEKLNMQGVDDVRWAIIRATGLESYVLSLLRGHDGQITEENTSSTASPLSLSSAMAASDNHNQKDTLQGLLQQRLSSQPNADSSSAPSSSPPPPSSSTSTLSSSTSTFSPFSSSSSFLSPSSLLSSSTSSFRKAEQGISQSHPTNSSRGSSDLDYEEPPTPIGISIDELLDMVIPKPRPKPAQMQEVTSTPTPKPKSATATATATTTTTRPSQKPTPNPMFNSKLSSTSTPSPPSQQAQSIPAPAPTPISSSNSNLHLNSKPSSKPSVGFGMDGLLAMTNTSPKSNPKFNPNSKVKAKAKANAKSSSYTADKARSIRRSGLAKSTLRSKR